VLSPSALWPRVAQAVGGIIGATAGVLLLPRPLTTLELSPWLFATSLLAAAALVLRTDRRASHRWLAALALLAAAVAVAVAGVRILPLVPVALSCLAAVNAVRLVTLAVRRRRPGITCLTRAVWALASGAGAVLLWLWPDATLLLLAWAIAATLVVAGLLLAWRAVRARPRAARRVRPGPRLIGALLVAALAVPGAAVTVQAMSDVPAPDAFYSWTGPLPEQPGVLLRVAPYEGEAPADARALRMLYTTTRSDGSITLASAVVAVPTQDTGSARIVLAWQHGTTGVARSCAPSLRPDALTEEAIPGIAGAIERGWVVVATDYPGQGTTGRYPYLIGEGEGRATLDAARAAGQIEGAGSPERVMLWGHSQGGHATLWAAQIAPEYSPELDVVGVAALSAASDPLALARRVTQASPGPLSDAVTSYVVVPYSDEYADVALTDVTHPAGVVFTESAASRCATDRSMLVTLLVGVGLGDHDRLYQLDLDAGPVHDRLVQNTADGLVPAPLFLGQGTDDEVVPIEIQRTLTAALCTAGRAVSSHEYPGRSHMGVIAEDSPLVPELLAWADEVVADGSPSTCR